MRITHKKEDGEGTVELYPLQAGEGYSFDGGLDTYCHIDAPTRDFNVMALEESVDAFARLHSLLEGNKLRVPVSGDTVVLHSVVGGVVVQMDEGGEAAQRITVTEGEMLKIQKAEVQERVLVIETVEGTSGTVQFIVVTICKKGNKA